MHPENFFKAPQGKRKKTITAEELADSGADLERESYVIISTLAMAILRACSMHSIKTVTFFEDLHPWVSYVSVTGQCQASAIAPPRPATARKHRTLGTCITCTSQFPSAMGEPSRSRSAPRSRFAADSEVLKIPIL